MPIITFVPLGGERHKYLEKYGEVTPALAHYARHAMPYEDSLDVFIARGRQPPIEEDSSKAKHYE